MFDASILTFRRRSHQLMAIKRAEIRTNTIFAQTKYFTVISNNEELNKKGLTDHKSDENSTTEIKNEITLNHLRNKTPSVFVAH